MIQILLVEDNADDIELAQRVFEKCGVIERVHIAKDGASALDFIFGTGPYRVQGISPDLRLVLIDLDLPKVPGLEVVRRIKSDKRTDRMTVMMLTSSKEERELRETYQAGVDGYLCKPMDYDQFMRIHKSYVERP